MKADCKIFPFWQIKNEVMLLAFQSRTVVENVNSANILIINLTIATEPIEKIVSDMLGFILKKEKKTEVWKQQMLGIAEMEIKIRSLIS